MSPLPPTAICKVMPAWQSARGLTKYIYKKSIYSFGSLSMGAPTGDMRLDAEALVADHFSASRACEVRHVAFSFPPEVGLKEALERLPKMAADWIKKYAPDRDWVAGIHYDNGLYHVHLGVQNVKDGKALRLLPHQVVAMSQMKFTVHARDAKGVGSPGLKFYTKPSKPLIADAIRTASKEQLSEWIEAGCLRVGRIDSRGVITSVEWDGGNGKKPRRIRLDTIQRLAARAAAAPAGDREVSGGGAGRNTGLDRRGRQGSGRQPAGDFGGRRFRRDVGLRHEPASSFHAQRRPAGVGLFRDRVPDSRLATPRRRRLAPGTRRPIAVALRGLGRLLTRSLIDADALGKFTLNPITIRTKTR